VAYKVELTAKITPAHKMATATMAKEGDFIESQFQCFKCSYINYTRGGKELFQLEILFRPRPGRLSWLQEFSAWRMVVAVLLKV
jgi:hypothetical protein